MEISSGRNATAKTKEIQINKKDAKVISLVCPNDVNIFLL